MGPLSVVWCMISAACLTVGVLHLIIGLLRSDGRRYLVFGATVVVFAVQILIETRFYNATDHVDFHAAYNLGLNVDIIAILLLNYFIYCYTEVIPGRWAIAASSPAILTLVVNVLSPTGVMFRSIDQVGGVVTPWGETIQLASGELSPLVWLIDLSLLGLTAYYGYTLWRLVQLRRWRPVVLLGGSLLLLTGAVVHGVMVVHQLVSLPLLVAPAILALVCFMSAELCIDIIHVPSLFTEIRENERRWRALLENVHLLVAGVDGQGRVNYVNPFFLQTTGHRREDVVGSLFAQILAPADPAPLEELFDSVTRGRAEPFAVTQLFTRRGEQRTVRWSSVTLRDDDGKTTGFLTIGLDVTDSLAAEEALRESEERFARAVAGSTDGLWDWNVETKQVWYSDRFKELLRCSDEEFPNVIGSLNNRLHPDDYDAVWDGIDRHFYSGEAFDVECRLRLSSGNYHWFRLRGQAVWNSEGQPTRMSGSIQDITDRILREQERNQRIERVHRDQMLVLGLAIDSSVAAGELDRFIAYVNEVCADAMEVERVSVWRLQDDENTLECLDLYQRKLGEHSSGMRLTADKYPNYFQALRRERSIEARDALGDRRTIEFAEDYIGPYGVTSMLDTAIHVAGKLVGVICMGHVGPMRDWSPDDVLFATSVSDQIAQAFIQEQRNQALVELQRKEDALRTITDAVPGMVYQTELNSDGEHRFLFCSQRSRSVVGHSPEELLEDFNLAWSSVIEEDHDAVIQSISDNASTLRSWNALFRIRRRDGQLRWLEGHSAPYLTSLDEGKIVYNGIILDVTEREQNKEAFRRIVEGTSNVTGKEFFRSLVYHLASTLEVSHAILAEVVDRERMRVRTIGVWADGNFAEDYEREVADSPFAAVLEGNLSTFTQVQQRFPNDPRLESMGVQNFMGVPLMESSGEVMGFLAVLDKSYLEDAIDPRSILQIFAARAAAELERTKKEEEIRKLNLTLEDRVEQRTTELRQSESKYRRLVEGLQDEYLFFSAQPEGRITYVSPSVESILGYTSTQELPKSFSDVVFGSVHSPPTPADSESDKSVPKEYEFVRKDGERRLLEVLSVPVYDDENSLIALEGMARDVTEHKKAEVALRQAKEAAEAATLAKSQFLANMSHELRTPLNGVIGMVDLLRQTRLTSEQHRFVDIARTSGELLLSIINEVLDFSKIEAGKLDLEVIEFNLAKAAGDVAESFRHKAEQSGLHFSVRVDDRLSEPLMGDPSRLRQVLGNLLSNAVKFTEKGAVSLHVRQTNETEKSVTIRAEVRDSGIGVSPEMRTRLFESFSQVDVSMTRRFGGTGLGLAICKELVEMMDGEIGVYSQPGRGSTFWFTATFQRGTVESRGRADADQRRLRDETFGKGRRILVVEDNAINAEVACAILNGPGFCVDVAADGYAAVERILTGVYDLVLMDCQLPELDGYAATQRVRELESSGERMCANEQPLPIIALTAGATTDQRERCLTVGMDDFVAKPINADQLLSVIARHLPAPESTSCSLVQQEHRNATEIVDLETALKRLNGNKQLLTRVAEKFLGSAADALGNLEQAVARRDRQQTEFLSHRLKGQVATFAAHQLIEKLQGIESLAGQGMWDDVEDCFEQFKVQMGELVQTLESFVEHAHRSIPS